MGKNHKLLLNFVVILVFLFLVGCHNPVVEEKKVDEKISEVKDEVNLIPDQTKEADVESNIDTSERPKAKVEVQLSTGPVHECAFLEKDAGMKFCGFENEISGTKIFSCTQTFQQSSIPFAKVVISAINYSHPQIQESSVSKSISEKFEYDKKLDAGTDFLGVENAYLSEKNGRKAAFFRGNFLVRVTEVPAQKCFNFDDLVKKVVENVEKRISTNN